MAGIDARIRNENEAIEASRLSASNARARPHVLRRLVPVRAFFAWLCRQNHLLANPAAALELPRTEKRLPRHVLTAAEAKRMLASALGAGIHTEGDTLEELRADVTGAVDCHFDETMDAPKIIRLHFVRDEVLAR